MGNRSRYDTIFSRDICGKGVIDRSVNKLYTLAQDGDAILNPNGKTRVFQRNDLLKSNEHAEDSIYIEESESSQ